MGSGKQSNRHDFQWIWRHVINNTSNGTDHGPVHRSFDLAKVFWVGLPNVPGIAGQSNCVNPGAAAVRFQATIRYRYAKWLCMDATQSQTILNERYSLVPIFNGFASGAGRYRIAGFMEQWIRQTGIWSIWECPVYDHFIIERSVNGNSFQPVDTVMNVSNASRENYVFNDPHQCAGTILPDQRDHQAGRGRSCQKSSSWRIMTNRNWGFI